MLLLAIFLLQLASVLRSVIFLAQPLALVFILRGELPQDKVAHQRISPLKIFVGKI